MEPSSIFIVASGYVAGMSEYYAEDANGKLLATISPKLEADSTYSKRFLNVCTLDGKAIVADGVEQVRRALAAKIH